MNKFLLAAVILLLLAGCKKENQLYSPVNLLPGSYVQNEVLVTFKPGTDEATINKIISKTGASVKERVLTEAMAFSNDPGYYVLSVIDVAGTIEQLTKHYCVQTAEPDYLANAPETESTSILSRPSARTNTDLSSQQWNLLGPNSATPEPYGSNAEPEWATTKGSKNVYIGIINAGINYTHPDLVDNIWTNPFDPVDKKDNDGNGYVDDIHGWNFSGSNNKIDGECLDYRGSRVAGIIGAADNADGIIGASPLVTYISGKFMTCGGGRMNDVVKAIDYFVSLKVNHGLNIVALDNSWSTTKGARPSSTLQTAIERANKAGILLVASAADYNLNMDQSPIYPACYPNDNVIAIGSVKRSGGLTTNSNWGAQTVDLLAPGESIISTYSVTDPYRTANGTWEAAPHVSAAIALYVAAKGLTPTNAADAAAIKSAILNSTRSNNEFTGLSAHGLLDIYAACQ